MKQDDAQSDLDYKLLTIRLRVDCMIQSYNRLVRDTGRPSIHLAPTKKRKRNAATDSETRTDPQAGNVAEVTLRENHGGPVK